MKKRLYLTAFLSFVIVFVACASQRLWNSAPHIRQVSSDYYDAMISPVYIFDAYRGFILTIHNKASESIEVDWSNTFYMHNGKKEGGFWFEGLPNESKKEPPPSHINAEEMFTKEIFPAKLWTLSKIFGSYVHEEMKSGENGIYLTVMAEGKPIPETLMLNFSEK
jgi:hypothetical protein